MDERIFRTFSWNVRQFFKSFPPFFFHGFLPPSRIALAFCRTLIFNPAFPPFTSICCLVEQFSESWSFRQ